MTAADGAFILTAFREEFTGLMHPISDQIVGAAAMAVFGILCGVLYDIGRIIRIMLGIGCKSSANKKLDTVKMPFIGSVISRAAERDSRKTEASLALRFKIGEKLRTACEIAAITAGDLIFFAIVTVASITVIYNVNNGVPRWFHLISAVAGFAAYYFTLGRLIILLSDVTAFILNSAAAYFIRFIIKPPVRLLLFISTRIYRAAILFLNFINRRRNRAKTKRCLRAELDGVRAVFTPDAM